MFIRLLPVTMLMALLLLGIKVGDALRGSQELSEIFLASPSMAESEKKTEEKPEEKPKEDGKADAKAEAKPEVKPDEKKTEEKSSDEKKPEEKDAKKEEESSHGGGHGEEKKPSPEEEAKKEKDAILDARAKKSGTVVYEKGKLTTARPEGVDAQRFAPSELEVLKSLAKRREELETWEQNLQVKENLLGQTQTQITEKIEQLNGLKKELADLIARYNDQQGNKIQSLVRIYENMKPKEAARIFEEMDMPVLLAVVGKMADKKVAPVLAAMDPMKAKQITQDLADQRRSENARLSQAAAAAAPAAASAPKK